MIILRIIIQKANYKTQWPPYFDFPSSFTHFQSFPSSNTNRNPVKMKFQPLAYLFIFSLVTQSLALPLFAALQLPRLVFRQDTVTGVAGISGGDDSGPSATTQSSVWNSGTGVASSEGPEGDALQLS
jgi:hypothetical protein